MQFFDQYMESIKALPILVNRNLRLIRFLDLRIEDLEKELNDKQTNYFSTVKPAKDKKSENKKIQEQNKQLLEEIQGLDLQGLNYHKEKVEVAKQLHSDTSYYLEYLDNGLKQIEAELQNASSKDMNPKEEQSGSNLYNKTKTIISQQQKKQRYQRKKQEKSYDSETNKNTTIIYSENPSSNESWCYCNRPAFGEMICCENPNCTKQWFHISCAGISEEEAKNLSELKWYCKNCKK